MTTIDLDKVHPSGKPIEKLFGLMPSGESVFSYELVNEKGMKLKIMNLGATLTELQIPLKNGKIVDVVLGFDELDSYLKSFELKSAPYFGAIVGRFAGRINNGTFVLNDVAHILDKNNNGHSLHGGNNGFSQAIWKVKEIHFLENPSITLTHFSPDGDAKYPGGLTIDLTYTLSEENELGIEYKATTTQDTIVNLTHHSYFNLDGHSSNIADQEVFVNANRIVETTNENIPTGRFLKIENTEFDYLTPKKTPSKIDNTFVLDQKDELLEYKKNSKENWFWLNNFKDSYVNGKSPEEVFKTEAKINKITAKDIQKAAQKYLTKDKTVAILMPETK